MLTAVIPTIAMTSQSTQAKMSIVTRTITTVRRSPAQRILLSTRAHLDLHDKGLCSVAGAQEIIAAFRARKSVTKLILGHNTLSDDGTRELFCFLCSEEGRRYRISEITLNSNQIGNAGLQAIATYVMGNQHLRELFLQNNAFQGDAETAIEFSAAINSSKLELLSIASNQRLSDAFLIPFLSHLNSLTLHELQISAIGLTKESAPVLTAYLASPRSRALESLKCNGNALGARAVCALIGWLRSTNFTLQKLEVYANFDSRGDSEEGEEESVEESRAKWTASEQEMKNTLVRNELLKRKVHEETLRLLTYARALLLCSAQKSPPRSQTFSSQVTHIASSSSATDGSSTTSLNPGVTDVVNSRSFPFYALPTELQHDILSLLAPSLSALQRTRIFSFAADPLTLRPLLPSLHPPLSNGTGGCIPDPASLPFNSAPTVPGTASSPASPLGPGLGPLGPPISNADEGPRLGFSRTFSSPTVLSNPSPGPSLNSIPSPSMDLSYSSSLGLCPGGKCMGTGGSVLCHRAEIRSRWLTEVGCARFDSDGRGEAEVLLLLGDAGEN